MVGWIDFSASKPVGMYMQPVGGNILLARSHVPTERVEAIDSAVPNIELIFRWKERT